MTNDTTKTVDDLGDGSDFGVTGEWWGSVEVGDIVAELDGFEGSDALGNGDFSVCGRAAAKIKQMAAEIERLKAEIARHG